MTTSYTACILCSRNCGLEVDVEDGRFTKIRGDDGCPSSKGYICQKAARLQHYQSHADRLQHPLRRTADGSFERVSWDEAIQDIAARLVDIKQRHGGKAFAFYGGGGQGNHLGGAYGRQLLRAMGSHYLYNALGQEKTGDFWLNGRMFGRQTCHTTEDVENADFVMFIGTNPYQAHGIQNARDTLKHIKNDPARTMVVIDPRRTETARMADFHLPLRPGTDAYLMAALLAIIVRENLHDEDFLARNCTGFDAVCDALMKVPVEEYIAHTDLNPADVHTVARGFATARRACVRVDLGIQQTLNSTLNSYLEKLLFLLTGNFGIEGGNNLHAVFIPIIGHSDENNPKVVRTARHHMFPIAGIFPPNILASEIDHDGQDRVRALFVDSGNPALTTADSVAMQKALDRLELLVVVDVAMTETSRHAHYVLPASSQFEKYEATGFNLEFPTNYFHLRHPVFDPLADTLGEAEIYTRLLEAMGCIPKRFPVLRWVGGAEPEATSHLGYLGALALAVKLRPELAPYAASILYRTLGPRFGPAASAVTLLPMSIAYATRHAKAVKRIGVAGGKLTLGTGLFRRIMSSSQGTVISAHHREEMWGLMGTPDQRVRLAVPEMLQSLQELRTPPTRDPHFPLVLMAGERRSYNANQIFRDPQWRKTDPHGSLSVHPEDATKFGLTDGSRALCRTRRGSLEVVISINDSTRPGFVTLPHGYGMRFTDGVPAGPQLNLLTASEDCDPLTFTPHHKYVPAMLSPISASVS